MVITPNNYHHKITFVICVRQKVPKAFNVSLSFWSGDVHLPNGDSIDNFLTVDKDRIYMENIGAVKELCRVTDNLEVRIHELENLNRRSVTLTKMNSFKSVCSSGSNR